MSGCLEFEYIGHCVIQIFEAKHMHKFDFAEEAVLDSARRAYNEGCADFEVVSKKCVLLVMDTEPALVEISC